MRRALIALMATAALLASGGRAVRTAGRSEQTSAQTLQARLHDGTLTLRIGLARGHGYHIVRMGLEAYVAGVLVGEAAPDSPPAALEALAITVRTFAVANLGRHQSQGFDLCDQTHCQVYKPPTATTRQAAEATAGEVLFYDGAPAAIFYSAWCGGYTERPSEVWPGAADVPYLPSKPDPACAKIPGWSSDLRTSDLLRALHVAGFRGRRLRGVAPISRDPSGRVTRLRLDGMRPDTITGQHLRVAVGDTLGWQYIKSTLFTVRRAGNGYRFTGRGSGHGVGLCVLGSVAMAGAGQSARTILATYFPGTQIVDLASGTTSRLPVARAAKAPPAQAGGTAGIDVDLPGDPAGHAEVDRVAVAARDALAPRLGVSPPAKIIIRVEPTRQAYEQATGRPWYTAGATDGTVVTLAPLAMLRARGILTRTIRHEVVHVLTDRALAGRPRWVREGVALFYADPRPPGEIKAAANRIGKDCPSDAELEAPLSAGDLAGAWARAEACVATQIFKGRGWREVK